MCVTVRVRVSSNTAAAASDNSFSHSGGVLCYSNQLRGLPPVMLVVSTIKAYSPLSACEMSL